MKRPYALTGPHPTKSAAIRSWETGGRNDRRVTVRSAGGWYSFDQRAFEDDREALERLERYMEQVQPC